ncbi:hypothetical protein QBC46DRAFT_377374 [Diplogelasinospora grovesii]|uniref:NAD-dependent epimerase/dehydratase domain-containing protein n=1 Tax=Diplogelasinospora grovesii TaxID=303347 RepID=A0AAN6S7Q9_9PEZI|nr:hypothetical protein QBC46DRAFT_377374 [Diplogelasinospora grovesii]
MSSPSQQTLLVTGANSFVAGHIIKLALEKGYNVRGTVRTEAAAEKTKALFPQHSSQLSFTIVPDITKVENYESAFSASPAVTGVFHVASPFVFDVEDNAKDLLDPAIQGAVAILEAAKKYGAGKVRRVINTSSFAAIIDIAQGHRPGYTYTEADWNPMTYDEALKADSVKAYCASKGLAEKAMWDWVAEHEEAGFDLASISPPWVFGPHVGGVETVKKLNESTALLYKMFDAEKVPATDFAGFADVRDLAFAQLAAFEVPEAGGQRFLVGQHFDYQSAVDAGRELVPELKSRLPEGNPSYGKIEETYVVDGSKASKLLGLKYTSLEESMKDSFIELLEGEKRAAAAAASA